MSGFSRWSWIVAATVLVCLWPGRMALLDPDEARYAAAARAMADNGGDLLVPRFNGEPRLNKPPLFTWLQAAAFRTLGPGETAARLPSLLAAVATLLLVAGWARRRADADAGVTAAAVLATTPIFFGCARLGIIDMLMTLWVTGAVLCWHEAVTATDASARRRLAIAASVCVGMAALAKGPVGAALPAAIVGATALLARRRGLITARGALMALAGVVLVAGPWAVGLAGRIGLSGLMDLARVETIDRVVMGLDHPRPVYRYAITFWPLFLPWSVVAPVVVARAIRARREGIAAILPAAWLLAVLVFFSLSADKNDAYLLPAAPALALLAAARMNRRPIGVTAVVTAALLVAGVWFGSPVLSRDRSLRSLVSDAGLNRPGTRVLIGYRIDPPSLVFYSGSRVSWARDASQLRQALGRIPAGSEAVIVMTAVRYAAIRDGRALADLAPRLEPIGGQEGYVALRLTEPGG